MRLPPWLVPALLCGGALFLYLHRLATPSGYVYDEYYHAFTAAEYVKRTPEVFLWRPIPGREGVSHTWNHPPVGLHLISAGVALWGDRPLGWRFASALFGAAGIGLVWALGRALSGDRGVGELAAGLVLLDGLYFVQARTAMLDIFGTVFMLAALLAFHRHLRSPASHALQSLVATGVFLGLAVGTKWNAVYPAVIIGLVAMGRSIGAWRAARAGEGSPGASAWSRQLAWSVLAMVLVATAVYAAAYLPFFAVGYGIGDALELQRRIFLYHARLTATHAYASRWWEWPLALRPVWYSVEYYGAGVVANVYANVNPLLAWALLPAVCWVSTRWWRARRAAAIVLAIGFFGQWLPWALVPRATFVYHFLPAVPFGAVAVATVLDGWWRARGFRPWLAAGYVAAVALAFIFFHPIYASVPLSRPAFEQRLWLERWR